MIQILGKGGLAREVQAALKPLPSIMGEYKEIEKFDKKGYSLIAIGDVLTRRILAEKYKFEYATLCKGKMLDPDTIKLGKGTIICHGTILTTNIIIGIHCIINMNCTIGHDTTLGDFCTISPGVNISGNVKLGNNVFVGSNAVIREKINICDDAIIGAGAVIVKDITTPGLHLGAINRKSYDNK